MTREVNIFMQLNSITWQKNQNIIGMTKKLGISIFLLVQLARKIFSVNRTRS